MTKAEIEFLRAAGFSVAEIMAMNPVQNAENGSAASAGSAPISGQNAQTSAPDPTPAPVQPSPEPAGDPQPAPAPAQSAGNDPQTAMLDKLDKILAAVQAGNRSGAAVQTPDKKLTPEEIAGKLY